MKRKIAIAAGIALIVIAAAMFIVRLPESQSYPAAFDDHDLMPDRVEIPPELNGYSLLLQAGQSLTVTGHEPILFGGTNWNEREARDILTNNQAAMDLLHKALSLPFIQVAVITNYDQLFEYLNDWWHLAELASIEARLTFDSGDEAKGFSETMDIIRLGQHLEGADGVEIHEIYGRLIEKQGLWQMRQLIDKTTQSVTSLMLISKQLKSLEANQDGMRQALKMEYQLNLEMINDLVYTTNNPFYERFLFRPDKTRLDFVNQIRSTLQALTNCYATGIAYIPIEETNVSYIRQIVSGNMIGSALNQMTLDTRSGTLASKCYENVAVRATRTLLALRAFEMINHRPANSLQELVPDYLEAVPLDDFDGKPLRYSPSEKKVYSVGVDLIDSGGIESTNHNLGDIVFKYDF